MASSQIAEDLWVRTFVQSDHQIAADIINESIKIGDATLWQSAFSAADIEEQVIHQSEREETWMLRKSDHPIGWGVIKKYSPKEGYDRTCETSVFLSRSQTGKGYGKQFKSFLLNRCKALGYHHVLARILANNTISIAYNKQLGYETVGVQREIGFCNGEWVDVTIMQYIVPE